MAYVGTPLDTTNAFQSLAGKRFSGDASTTDFTLDSAPNSTLDIEVFVGNVRQDPNSAYTVSGTTLAFTGAPPSGTNNIYVVHQAKAVGTIDPAVGSTLDLNGAAELVLDADADTTITADTDDQIDIKIAGADDFQFTANTFTAQSGSTITTPTLGVGDTKDLGAGLHIKTADSGASVDSAADELVIEGSGASGMTLLSGTSSSGSIYFGDSGDNDIGYMAYNHSDNYMMFGTNAAERMRIDSNGDVGIGTNNPQYGKLQIDTDYADGQGRILYGALTGTSGTSPNNGVLFSANSSNFTNQFIRFHMESPNANQKIIYCTTTGSNTEKFGVDEDGDVVSASNSYGSTSDERIKQNITDANSQWDDIKAVKVRNFKKKQDTSLTQIGVIAQELESSGMTGLITERDPDVSDVEADSSFGTIVDDTSLPKYDDGTYHKKVGEVKAQVKEVKYSVLYMKAIKALQEAQTRIETLETKVKTLEDA